MSIDATYALVTCAGLTAITVITRCFFFISEREMMLPSWLKRGLRYAPLGALAAVIAPEVLINADRLIDTWRDARLIAFVVASAYYFWRRSLLGTIVVGMLVLLPLRIGLGW